MTVRAKLRSLAPARAAREAISPGRPVSEADDRPGPDTFEWRGSDGPVDTAHYACTCGFQFAARVATTVSCPHCGAGQAW